MVKLRMEEDGAELLDFAIKPGLKQVASGLDIKRINTAVSGPSALIRYVLFPRMNPQELKQALRFEAQKHIPFAVSELNMDACILKAEMPDNKMLVLLAAIKKDNVEQRIEMIRSHGLEISVIDFDAVALVNAFNFSYADDPDVKGKTIALLNIGASFSNLNILEDGIPRMSRDIHQAGNHLTQKLMDVFSVDFKTAEKIKRAPDPDKQAKVKTLTEAVLTEIAGEVRISFDFHESQSTSAVSDIFLTGTASIGPEVREILGGLLGMEVCAWDPLKKIRCSGAVQEKKIDEYAHELAVAVGLALRG